MNSYLLYKSNPNNSSDCILNVEIKVSVLRLSFFSLFLKEERKNLKVFLTRLYFAIITFFKAKIYIAFVDGNVAHFSYVIPKCYKFPFLERDDYEIGPCYTDPKYRGNGIYPAVLRMIISSESGNGYMLVRPDNKPSIKGIEKAGFAIVATCLRTSFKIYKMQGNA